MRKIKKTIAFFLSTILLTSTLVVPVEAVETNNVETNPTTIATKPVVEKTTKNVVDNKAKTKSKKVKKATEPTTEATVPLEPLPKEAFVAPSTSTKKKVTTGTKIEKLMTSATVAGGEISTDTSYETDLEDVWKDKYGNTWATQKVKMEYFTSGSSNSIYRYPNGTNWYSGKLARVTFTVGDTVAVWTVDKSSLSKGGTVEQGKGTLVVSRTTSSASAIPYFYYKDGGAKDKTKEDIYVYAPWNGTCKKKDSNEYKHPFSHNQVTAIEIDHKVSEIGDYNFYGFAGGFKKLIMHKETKIIGKAAFRASGVSNIIWNGTKTINPEAFAYCNSLTTVDFTQNTDSNTNYNHTLKDPGTADNTSGYSVGCFQACSKLKTVKMGGITTIPIKCFAECPVLSDISWGNVKTIKAYAFTSAGSGTDGKGITLDIKGESFDDSGTDAAIRPFAFRNCKYKKITFSATKGNTRTGADAFYSADNLETVEIASGASITTISDRSFESCKALKSINVYGTKVTTIGAETFKECNALINGRTSTSGTAYLFSYTNSNINNNKTASGYNVLELPDTIKTIRQGAFRKCLSLRAVTWKNAATSIHTIPLTKILVNTFYNDINLIFFALPDKVTTIEGTYNDNDGKADNDKNFGAFVIGSSTIQSNYALDNFTLAITNNPTYSSTFSTEYHSALQSIGDKAFYRPEPFYANATDKNTGDKTKSKGLVLWDATAGKALGDNASTNSRLLVLPDLTYIGDRAFMNCASLTGSILSMQYMIIGHRAFVNTKLTDFYFKWDPYADKKQDTFTTVNSSLIGSSNSFINNQSRNYTNSTNLAHTYGFSNYFSLYSAINKEKVGLIDIWRKYFANLKYINEDFDTWVAQIAASTLSNPKHVPESSVGKDNGVTKKDDKYNLSMDTATYLKTYAKWNTINKTATETVEFAYKNRNKIDYVFVVDNSPSMDRASKKNTEKNLNHDQIDKAGPYEGANNASKMMNAYSQIYDISEQILQGNGSGQDNTVSVISFRGNNKNELQASSKFLSPTGTQDGVDNIIMDNAADVKKALFENPNGYDDDNDGVTNFSSGLSRAYSLISGMKALETQNVKVKRDKVVIMITDGKPTYYDGAQAVNASSDSNASFAEKQVNGVDWARAIRETGSNKKVHAFVDSYYNGPTDNSSGTSTSVDGLGVDIYGIIVGDNSYTARKNMEAVTKDSLGKVFASTNLTSIATALSNIVLKVQSENYKIVVPFDNNFEFSNPNKIRCYEYSKDGLMWKDISFIKSSDGKYYTPNENADKATYKNITLEYDKDINAVIISFKYEELEMLPTPYLDYEINIPLIYVGKETSDTVSTVKYNGVEYIGVSNNSSDTSKNGTTNLLTGLHGSVNTNGNTINNTVNGTAKTNISGAYVLLNNTTLANYNEPIYLDHQLGTITLNKYATVVTHSNAGNLESKGDLLNGASFKVYRPIKGTETTNQIKVEEISFSSTDEGNNKYSRIEVSSGGSSTINGKVNTFKDMPYGTYYIIETDCPSGYVPSSFTDANETQYAAKNIYNDNGDLISSNAKEVVISSVTPNPIINLYNRPLQMGKVKGYKYGLTYGYNDQRAFLRNVEMGIYATWDDAYNRRNCIDTALTDKNSMYQFDMGSLKSNTTYYITEITAPAGYTRANLIREVTTSGDPSRETDVTVSDNPQYFWNVPNRLLTVYTDSSDNVQNGFDIQTTGSYIDENGVKHTTTYNGRTSDYDGDYSAKIRKGFYQISVPSFYAYSSCSGKAQINATWEKGRLKKDTGAEINDATALSGIYRRSNFISINNTNFAKISASIIDPSYKLQYNVFFYDANKNYLTALDKDSDGYAMHPPTRLTSSTFNFGCGYTNAAYMRIVCHRGTSLGGIDAVESEFLNGGIIKFEALSNSRSITDTYKPVEYTVKEVGFNGKDIPNHYIAPQYTLNNNILISRPFDDCEFKDYQLASVSDDWDGNSVNYYSSYLNYQVKNDTIYIFNPSYKVTVQDYDATDKTTPLNSSYKTVSIKNKNLSETKEEKLNITWANGRLAWGNGTEVNDETALSGIYRRSDYISTDGFEKIKVSILDDAYKMQWNLFWYDANHNYIESMYKGNPPKYYNSDEVSIPQNAAYVRIGLHRGTSLGGINSVEEDFLAGNIIEFSMLSNGAFTNEEKSISYSPESSENSKAYIIGNTYNNWVEGNIDMQTGEETESDQYDPNERTDYIAIGNNTKKVKLIPIDDAINDKYRLFFYNEDQEYIDCSELLEDTNGAEFSVPDNTKYIRIACIKPRLFASNKRSKQIDSYKDGTIMFDSWYGSNQFDVEQTEVEAGYSLFREPIHVANYPISKTIDATTGKRYYQIDLKVYNPKLPEFPKVGGNGYIKYIIIGVFLCLPPIAIYLIQKKRKRKYKV